MRAYKSELEAEKALRSFNGLECFVAKHYDVRVYHGKRYRKLVPLIHSLVFVRGLRDDIRRFKSVYTYLQYISVRDGSRPSRPLTVPDRQMEDFMRVARSYESDIRFLSPSEVVLCKGSRVRIIGGPFHGVVGHLLRDKQRGSCKVVVSLPGNLGGLSTAEIAPEWLEPLDD